MSTFENQFFRLTPSAAAKAAEAAGPSGYDLIIIGAGFGGGVLAADLFDRKLKKKILVIERGHLAFTTHCLNTARSGGTGDSGQQNDTFFQRFRSEYQTDNSPEWGGGPMYTLGGRSNAWGLFIPRPHRRMLDDYFPPDVVTDLRHTYFEKAESLMKLGFPETRPVHQRFIDNLNTAAEGVNWQWGRIASEFSRDTNFSFARGAYGTVDKLLEIAMVDPDRMANPNLDVDFRILLNAEVVRLRFGSAFTRPVESVILRDGTEIKTKRVVLCAGSVHSAAILLRSEVDLSDHLHLTDHAMYLVQHSYDYDRERQDIGSMKIQTFTSLGDNTGYQALANFAIDSSLFLSRPLDSKGRHAFTMVFILPSVLGMNNSIRLEKGEPVVRIERTDVPNKQKIDAMVTMVDGVQSAMRTELGVQFTGGTPTKQQLTDSKLNPLKLGNVAHELGSLPMRKDGPGAVDKDLALVARGNVHVCDLSVFPVSPAANPSLTLAALALRLSECLSGIL